MGVPCPRGPGTRNLSAAGPGNRLKVFVALGAGKRGATDDRRARGRELGPRRGGSRALPASRRGSRTDRRRSDRASGRGPRARAYGQSIPNRSSATFSPSRSRPSGIELDRRIVSVVQLGPNGTVCDRHTCRTGQRRTRIVSMQSQTSGLRTTVAGRARAARRGSGRLRGRIRRRIDARAPRRDRRRSTRCASSSPPPSDSTSQSTEIVRVGAHDVVIVTLVYVEPPLEYHLTGSAIVHHNPDDATVRAVLDATNRRLPHFAAQRPRALSDASVPSAVLVSFRLGGTDGVSIEARKWEWALRELGFATRRVAGELDDGLRPDDTWLAVPRDRPGRGRDVRARRAGRGTRRCGPRRRREPLLAAAEPGRVAHRPPTVLAAHDGRVRLPPPRPAVGAAAVRGCRRPPTAAHRLAARDDQRARPRDR